MKVFVDANFLIYLNASTEPEVRAAFEDFYVELVREHNLYTDAIVLDEVLWVSHRKYKVPFNVTSDFIRSIVVPFTKLIPLGEDGAIAALTFLEYGLKPSDALHLAAMRGEGINHVVSEDRELDRITWVRRIWPVKIP